jgi:predicted PurR-regulated permease PerM
MTNQTKNIVKTTHFIGQNRWLMLVIGFVFLTYLLSPILAPFLIAAVLAYICDPLVDKLCLIGFNHHKIPRTIATIIVLIGLMLVIVILFLILIPLLQKQTFIISQRLPLMLDVVHGQFEPWLQNKFGVSLNINAEEIRNIIQENWQGTRGFISNALQTAGSKGLALIGLLANIVLIPVVLFYLLRDWDILIGKIGELIPRKWSKKTIEIAKDVDNVVAEFLRGQLSVMLSLCVFYSIGLWLAELDMALSIGLIAGLLSFVPFIGFAVAFILALLLAVLQFNSLHDVIPVLIVFGVGQVIESYLLTPYLVGDRIGLHPVIVILALLAGGQLFGFVGVLLALPISAAIAVGLTHLKESYLTSDSYLT